MLLSNKKQFNEIRLTINCNILLKQKLLNIKIKYIIQKT
jgi:hypothetical protein